LESAVKEIVQRHGGSEYELVAILNDVQKVCGYLPESALIQVVAILAGGRIRAFDSVANLTNASDRPTVAIDLADPGDRNRASAVITALPFVTRCDHDSSSALHCTLSDPGATPDLIAALVGANLRIEEVRRSSRSLEEIYLEHVGSAGGGV
jgi:ABC-2 type transport system ATP-binding protein